MMVQAGNRVRIRFGLINFLFGHVGKIGTVYGLVEHKGKPYASVLFDKLIGDGVYYSTLQLFSVSDLEVV